ncbi:down syndrome cell adhesion molecule-like protein Dscam2 [Trichonephila clavata]|uniref:Down syndrome cell adhesion molecule-like protein Dscam2 n=1 Tax=Trichonephila clavata TaxID=2740835 RepID=A0A8X6G4F0_TRICU|nr:down syndrome cell adhesion molecule-like protein Dscam2 [Trichonephila clavata]
MLNFAACFSKSVTQERLRNVSHVVPPRWVIEPSDVFVVKGRSITVDCQTEGFPQPRVRWTKAEGDSPRDYKAIVSSPHLQVFENGSLSITDATESDAGYYLCQASNGIGQGLSKVVRLKVYSK